MVEREDIEEILASVYKRPALSSEIFIIDLRAALDPKIGAPITELMEGPDLGQGVDRRLRNRALARRTQIEYTGDLGGGTPKNSMKLNTSGKRRTF